MQMQIVDGQRQFNEMSLADQQSYWEKKLTGNKREWRKGKRNSARALSMKSIP